MFVKHYVCRTELGKTMFLNRKREIKLLKGKLKEKGGSLIILYGRRRIGKSELLKHVLSSNDIYFLADLREKNLQINSFRIRLSEKFEGFGNIAIKDWDSFFSILPSLIHRKTTIVLDEFPYLVKNAPALPSIIQKHIDLDNLKNINLILCGSSQSMMTNLFNSSKAPLYGRADLILKLDYLPIYYLMELLNVSPERAIEEYSVWGGVPRYWQERAKYRSLEKAVLSLVMNKYGLFYDEPIILFLDEMRTSMQSNSILSLVAGGSNKLSEIAGRLQKPATHLSKPLQILIELGYLKREIPFGENQKNAKKTLYKIKDPFLRFYFTYVVPNRSIIELELKDIIRKNIKSHWNNYVSEIYEDLCRNSVTKLFKNSGTFLPAKRYWTKDVEIDILTKEQDSGIYIVGEVKWTEKLNISQVMNSLEKKIEKVDFLKNAEVIKVVFGKKPIQSKSVKYFSANDVLNAGK